MALVSQIYLSSKYIIHPKWYENVVLQMDGMGTPSELKYSDSVGGDVEYFEKTLFPNYFTGPDGTSLLSHDFL